MAATKLQNKLTVSMGLKFAEDVIGLLREIRDDARLIRELDAQRKYYELPVGGTATVGESQWKLPHVAHGQTFLVDRLTAFAPEGAQLEIYENNVSPSTFREVVTNVQRYANNVPGTLNFEGPTKLIAVLTNVKAEGAWAMTLSGFLVPTNYRDLHLNRYQPAVHAAPPAMPPR